MFVIDCVSDKRELNKGSAMNVFPKSGCSLIDPLLYNRNKQLRPEKDILFFRFQSFIAGWVYLPLL